MIITGVGHRFLDGPWLFRDISETFEPGTTTALTGPSGSGKSTMLAILAGWTSPAEGTVSVPSHERTAWVFQNPHGSPRRTARDHVALPLLARRKSPSQADAEALEILDTFGLASRADSQFRELSGGEAQRLMLARAVASEPLLMLVDEPTAQLDPVTAATVNQTLASTATRGATVVIATHDPATRDLCMREVLLGAPLAGLE